MFYLHLLGRSAMKISLMAINSSSGLISAVPKSFLSGQTSLQDKITHLYIGQNSLFHALLRLNFAYADMQKNPLWVTYSDLSHCKNNTGFSISLEVAGEFEISKRRHIRWARALLGGSGACSPRKFLKFRGTRRHFLAFRHSNIT